MLLTYSNVTQMVLVALGLLHADGRTDKQKLMGGSQVLKFVLLILYSSCMVSATLLAHRFLGDTKCGLHTANGNWKLQQLLTAIFSWWLAVKKVLFVWPRV